MHCTTGCLCALVRVLCAVYTDTAPNYQLPSITHKYLSPQAHGPGRRPRLHATRAPVYGLLGVLRAAARSRKPDTLSPSVVRALHWLATHTHQIRPTQRPRQVGTFSPTFPLRTLTDSTRRRQANERAARPHNPDLIKELTPHTHQEVLHVLVPHPRSPARSPECIPNPGPSRRPTPPHPALRPSWRPKTDLC